MITLKTLPEASAQEVFDQVARHLLTQNKQSVSHGSCVYRSDDGLMCAAGCLMSKEEYRLSFEGTGWHILASEGKVPEAHKALIGSLQGIHDTLVPEAWKSSLLTVALRYKLNTEVLEDDHTQKSA